jgi:coniferyl-aldehyde dehydrogenase
MLAPTLDRLRAAHLADPVPSLAWRRDKLERLHAFVTENAEDLTAAVDADYGHRSWHETMLTEISPLIGSIRHAERNLRRWMRPRRRGIDRFAFGLARNEVIPQPLGVVGIIVPWNFPINLSLMPLVSVLAAGNRAMVKMSENSRRLTQLMIERLPRYVSTDTVEVFEETGGIGEAFSRLRLDHLLFTGSSETGRKVMAAAAANLCPVTLELGGRSPAIVCDDFDLATAARRLLFVKYLNAGQICTTVDHVYLPHDRVAEFVERARAIVVHRYPTLDCKDYTSIIDQRAYDRLVHALHEAGQRGAEVVPLLPTPLFDAPRRRIAPHIVIDPPDDCELMRREIFGPILPVVPYRSIDDVIARINAGPRPLAIYPFAQDRATVDRIIARAMSGGVTVNDALMHVAQHDLPFGGVGESGMGHYHGWEGFATFSKLRPVFRQSRWATSALLTPPYGRFVNRMIARFAKGGRPGGG